jgi:hypothetical protein
MESGRATAQDAVSKRAQKLMKGPLSYIGNFIWMWEQVEHLRFITDHHSHAIPHVIPGAFIKATKNLWYESTITC